MQQQPLAACFYAGRRFLCLQTENRAIRSFLSIRFRALLLHPLPRTTHVTILRNWERVSKRWGYLMDKFSLRMVDNIGKGCGTDRTVSSNIAKLLSELRIIFYISAFLCLSNPLVAEKVICLLWWKAHLTIWSEHQTLTSRMADEGSLSWLLKLHSEM